MTYIHNWKSFNEEIHNDISLSIQFNDFDFVLEGNNSIEFLKEKIKNIFFNLKTKAQIKNFLKYSISKIFNSSLTNKRILIIFILSLTMIKISSSEIKSIDFHNIKINSYINDLLLAGIEPQPNINYNDAVSDETLEFLDKLSFRESSNNWKSAKKGYVGQYQFGKYAFADIGKQPIDSDEFINNPDIYSKEEQNKDVIKLLKKNKYYLRNYYKYIGQTINGVEITESGMLAASHLVGQNAVKRFLASNGKNNDTDGNGVPCSNYLKYFTGYKLNII
jgi:hypothetical protein